MVEAWAVEQSWAATPRPAAHEGKFGRAHRRGHPGRFLTCTFVRGSFYFLTALRAVGSDAAHPEPSQAPTGPQDARDVVAFMDLLFEFLYDLPDRIEKYRQRREP